MGCHHREKKHCDKNVKYVRGGGCESGNGSKCNPWNSLALAEADHTWKKLVVLPSPVALDGGISLRAGTKLEGIKSPVHGALEWDQPTITNSSAVSNGGNGVYVLGGDVKVKNIYFRDTFAAAVNYDNGRDIKIKNVLVTGQNQGANTVTVVTQKGEQQLYIGGIQSVTTNNGNTIICDVVIRDFDNAQGVYEGISLGTQRTVKVYKLEVSGMTVSVDLDPSSSAFQTNAGLGLYAIDVGSKHTVSVKKSFFHDYDAKSVDKRLHGVSTRAYEGAYYNLSVTDTKTYNLATDFARSVYMFGNTNDPESLNKSKYDVLVKDCVFEEPNRNNDAAGIQQRLYNSIQNIKILNNTIINFYDTISNYVGGTTVQNELIEGNDAEGDEAFCLSVGANFRELGIGNTVVQHITIKNNNYLGGFDLGAIIFGANFSGGNNGWSDLKVDATGNCFVGGFIGIAGVNFGATAGNGTINAHNNNFTNFSIDIADGLANPCNFDYFAQQNFWDGVPNVINDGTGVVDVSNPLLVPITCPKKRYCFTEPIQIANSEAKVSSLTNEERLEKVKEKLQNKQ